MKKLGDKEMSQPGKLTEEDKKQLNDFETFFSFQQTWLFSHFLWLPHRFICLFPGNQFGKTAYASYNYCLRILGWHPVPHRNILFFECPRKVLDDNHEEILNRFKDKIHNRVVMSVALKYGVSESLLKEWLKDFPEGVKVHKWIGRDFDGIQVPICRQGTYTDPLPIYKMFWSGNYIDWGNMPPKVFRRPEDNSCPVCGEQIRIHVRKTRIYRFMAQNLPTEKAETGVQSAEIRSSQYPAFKKWLPPFLIKKDITVRRPAMTLMDINHNREFGSLGRYKGDDITVEFTSYSQLTEATAGQQRLGVWADEEPPIDMYEEQLPRLYAEDGDFIITVTPANQMTWTYDTFFENAGMNIRTENVQKGLYRDHYHREVPLIELHDTGNKNVCVLEASGYDNPTLTQKAVDELTEMWADPDGTIRLTRVFGAFMQASGRIFPTMNTKIHVIKPSKYGITPETMLKWRLGRAEDFHTANNHAIIWAALSPENECFVYREWNPLPDDWTTEKLCREMAKRSGNEKYALNLIDPLAKGRKNETTKKNTVDEMNDHLFHLRREGIGKGGVFEAWNTKGEVGRDAIKQRLFNSVEVQRPFNNRVVEGGRSYFLPTLWIFDSCPFMWKSLKFWRMETWKDNKSLFTKEKKEAPAQRWSHFCTALEALFKDKRFSPPINRERNLTPPKDYFKHDPRKRRRG